MSTSVAGSEGAEGAEPRGEAEALVWLNGALLPAGRARIAPDERGFLLGDGLFETLLAVDGRAPLLGRHLARLVGSAKALGMRVPASLEAIPAAVAALLDANDLARGTAALRITLGRGPGPRGLEQPSDPRPTLLISTARTPDPREAPPAPARLWLGSLTVHPASPLRRHKTLSSLENVLARREARARGADEALLLNIGGGVAEAAAANVFARMGRELRSPEPSEGALPGITRGLVLEMARDEGLRPRELRLRLEDLARADAVFLTSSLAGPRAVVSLEGLDGGRRLDWPKEDAVVARLRARWLEALVPR